MLKHLVFLSALALSSTPAFAGTPSDAVRYFYDHLGAESEFENRGRFTGPALDFLNAADAAWIRDETNCIEFGFAIDAQDFDEAEIARTLKLDETVDGDTAHVVAQFNNFGLSTVVEWMLSQSAAGWQVSDIASDTNDWRVSAMSCK
ncbi:hypothetical protein IMCC20628_03004 [Hoeflea sp. IMCC20628]|uniref:hypothetical protein n=1 Tax=Hoeflea sp. IMCC20628 TaxID=1620421 RepID=UPI00063BE838|nr:hypothetical protein [Hoeflea sp. IMCC20628]AKI01698.1 hypothetical protein IMCC20628_03004 [Hoeflea sp. IMCC20628]